MVAAMADQYLESRVARLESAVAHMGLHDQLAESDRRWRRDQTVFDILMLLLNAVTIAALAHGFK